ncbi:MULTISPECIES: hypothetical protein [Rhodococcus]|uniref:hypothetical protein n=1 Tax=Rhodococcus TaxID=1827 RepID=UPI002953A38F|nr:MULTISPECIES: hypothetical protein [Rhodococcus]MDV7246568.1 hypothetical protein [Rhodococcus oxybenzonivorans]MDV7337580.1 hypothetical protein [Rhodococcus oxybenzonivorans]MDV8031410.1 hypothetical protein [Rhodococcus sp. IEGM 27]
MNVELLVVPGCPHEAAARTLLDAALVLEGLIDVEVHTTVIDTEIAAHARHFTGSPTILIDGTDPFASPANTVGLSCRMYVSESGLSGTPSLAQLRRELRRPPRA